MKPIELRARDGAVLKRCTVKPDAIGAIPDVVIDWQPDGSMTVYHQVSNGRMGAVYVESIISLIGGFDESTDRGEVPGEPPVPAPEA